MWWRVSADDVFGNVWELKRGSDDGDENGVDGADGTGVICNKECCFFRHIDNESICIAAKCAPRANSWGKGAFFASLNRMFSSIAK